MFHKGHRGGRIFFKDAAPSPNSQKFGGSGALVWFLSLILLLQILTMPDNFLI